MFLRITALQSFHDQLAQICGGRQASGRRVAGKLRFAERKSERAALCNLMAAREQLGMCGKQFLHLACGTKMIFPIEPLSRMLLAKQGQRADALDDVILPTVGRKLVMDRK